MPETGGRQQGVRRLPSVDKVLTSREGRALSDIHGHDATVAAIRTVLAEARNAARPDLNASAAAAAAGCRLEAAAQSRLKPVYNLTGTVLHTNLGRAQIAEEAIAAASEAMRRAVALEFDVGSGQRGERDDLVRGLICDLTGAEAATVVNNNAAAVLIALNTFAEGRGAIVSRGELIEIGGAFRMPDIMSRAGVRLVEVGTTNRTHPRDYEGAVDNDTGLLLKVHTSNYRIEGFTAAVSTGDLAGIAVRHGVPLLEDLGSGTLIGLERFGLPHEPTVSETLAAGADLVTFSGDKLLGGPQAGFIVGRKELIARINKNPMKRALRVDKIRLAAIEATLRLYRDPDRLAAKLPTYRALSRVLMEIERLADRVQPRLQAAFGAVARVERVACASQVGSGAVPLETLPSAGLAITPLPELKGGADRVAAMLRSLPAPVIGRIRDGVVILDLRCLEDADDFIGNVAALDRGLDAGKPG